MKAKICNFFFINFIIVIFDLITTIKVRCISLQL